MQGYCKYNLGTSITANYIGLVEASMQYYSKGNLEPSITVRYNV
jgi:hypothetical protein